MAEPHVEPEAARPRSNWLLRAVLLILIPALLIAGGYWAWRVMSRYASTDDAYVKGDVVLVSPQVSGDVVRIAVAENQPVQAGDLLLEIQSDDAEIAVQRARAQLDTARTNVTAMQANHALQAVEINVAREQARFAKIEWDRQKDLASRKLAAQADVDNAQKSYEMMYGLSLILQGQMHETEVRLGGKVEAPVDEHPEVRAALSDLERARLDLERTRLRAPRAGIVSRLPKVGDFLAAGVPALSVVSDQGTWIEANFKETDLTRMRPGQPVRIDIDTYPDYRWRGRVESIAQATGAEFALLPPQNASGNWVKVVQRIPVRIAIDHQADAPLLRVGMSATVRVDLGRKPQPGHATGDG